MRHQTGRHSLRPPPACSAATPSTRRVLLLPAALAVLLLLAALAPAFPLLQAAPASAYVLLADLPGAPAGPIAALLGTPAALPWKFHGAEGEVVADVYVPPGGGRHPAILIVNGALNAGRKYPALESFGEALAQSGYTAVIPDYPDLLKEELTPASLRDVEYTVQHAAGIPGVEPARIDLVGFCVGATLGLLTVEDPQMPPLRAVVDLSGYISSLDMIQVITTGTYTRHGTLVPYSPDPWVVVAVARSLVQGLPAPADRAVFAPFLTDPPPTHYVAPNWAQVPANRLSAGGRALLRLLENRDPARVPGLMAALPAPLPAQLAALSPQTNLALLRTPVYIVADRHDPYIPDVESRKLQEAEPALVHLSYVSILAHVEPTLAAESNPVATIADVGGGAWELFRAIDATLGVLH